MSWNRLFLALLGVCILFQAPVHGQFALPTDTTADTSATTETSVDTSATTETSVDTSATTETSVDTSATTETSVDTSATTETSVDTNAPTGTSADTNAPTGTTEDPIIVANRLLAAGKGLPGGSFGNGKQYPTIAPADLAKVPETNKKHTLQPDLLPDGRHVTDLTDNYEVVNGVDEWSKIVANKKGYFVLHPVQRQGETLIFDPYTIGQVLGYLYEYKEFNGQKPKNGWTIELMGKTVPVPAKKKRSADGVKSRRATLVFTKKPEVVAKEERDYWKKVLASI